MAPLQEIHLNILHFTKVSVMTTVANNTPKGKEGKRKANVTKIQIKLIYIFLLTNSVLKHIF